MKSGKEFRLVGESMSFGRDLKKISDSFYLLKDFILPNGHKIDFIIIGSSGVWIITVKDDRGRITFNGDDLLQDDVVLKGILTQSLERSYALAGLLKQKLNKDFTVTPVIVFSSPNTQLIDIPKPVRGVYAVSHKDAVGLIENTDVQLIDKTTIDDVDRVLKTNKP